MTYLICDHLRLADLIRMDTTAPTVADAKQAAEAMAKRFATTVTVLAPVAVCEGGIEPRWTQDFPNQPQMFGWVAP